MYLPAHFAEPDPDWAAAFIERVSFGHWVSVGDEGVCSTPMPWLMERRHNRLLGHVARANPQWQLTQKHPLSMVIFSDANTYISPNDYPSKAEHHRVVPTWNYEVVHVSGKAIIHDNADWLLGLVSRLADHHEQGQAKAWKVSDAPSDYIAGMLKNIVGVEIEISRIEAKRKLSQNRDEKDRWGVIEGLRHRGSPGDVAVADLMDERES